jgi:ribonuclease J
MRHLRAHIELATSCQVRQAILAPNGTIVRLAPGPADIVGEATAGRIGLDGSNLLPLDGPVLKNRQRMAHNGVAVATLVLDGSGRLLGDPQLTVRGLIDTEAGNGTLADAVAAAKAAVTTLPAGKRAEDATVKEAVRIAIRRALFARSGKKPLTDVHLVRLPGIS